MQTKKRESTILDLQLESVERKRHNFDSNSEATLGLSCLPSAICGYCKRNQDIESTIILHLKKRRKNLNSNDPRQMITDNGPKTHRGELAFFICP